MTPSRRLLDTIDSPVDLRKLPERDLIPLAAELRQTIIETVAQCGGHLAPSLGVVELTLALHYVFDTPYDKVVWDVGHQSYAHKLLTGRRERFHTLRQYKGISGFPKRTESPYDAFDTGHSSTSISASLGMAMGKQLKGDKHRVIAVIGDGSMTGGMAFEGLNQTGHLGSDLIVILNDNEMSISPNVGALSSFLSRKLTGRTISNIKREMEHFLKSFHHVGESVLHLLKRSEESLKGFFTPGMLFEALKFEYIGPIPGHSQEALLETFRNVKEFSKGPVLIHILTTKGKGYKPAEDNPGEYHGLGPFDVRTGVPLPATSGPITYTKAFGRTLVELAQKDRRIVAISAAMPAGTGLTEFAQRFPERFFDVGIAEGHAVTFAAGLAAEGLFPVVAIYSTFLQRSFDQIIHDVCLQNLPVIFAIDRGGLVGDDGPTHHGAFDLSYLRLIPNMVVMAPKDEDELRKMLVTALAAGRPCAVRYPRGAGEGVALTELEPLPLGKGEVLREGRDLLLLPVGNCVYAAMEAAEGLEKLGVSAAVVNPRFVKPLDGDLLEQWARQIGKVVVVEENSRLGGFGAAVLELFAARGVSLAGVKLLGLADTFYEHGPQEILRHKAKIDSAAITQAGLELVQKSEG